MTSKEAVLELICEAKSANIDEGRVCFLRKTIEKDLDRLEKLEKTIELLKARVKMLETYHEQKSRDYYLYIGGRIVLLSREEYKLLKEVLECQKD